MEDEWRQKIEMEIKRQGVLLDEIHVAMIGKPMSAQPGFAQNLQRLFYDYYGVDERGQRVKDGTKTVVDDLQGFKAKLVVIYGTLSLVAFCIWELLKVIFEGRNK